MRFAAEFYALKNKANNIDMRLAAISMTDEPPAVESYLELE